MSSGARMTTERFFGGVNGRIGNLKRMLEFVADYQPSESRLIEWILENTSAGSENTVRRNISFLVTIDLLEESGEQFQPTNKGAAFVRYDEPLVMYEGLAQAVDGFREIVRAISDNHRTRNEIQIQLQQAYPDFELPQGVVSKHLDWLVSLDLVTESADAYSIPIEGGDFTIGDYYSRWFIHDVFAGGRYSGISTPSDEPMIFIFTGDSGSNYGYEDEFLDDDSFRYTGEGAEGDMTMDGGNAAIRDHKANSDTLHLFENTDLPWIVSYLGEYEHEENWTTMLDDENNNRREAIQFKLVPAGGKEIEMDGSNLGSLSGDELFKQAKQHSPTDSNPNASSESSRSGKVYRRSAVVREFALWDANGVCQGCEQDAPFLDENGEPYLEVHHLTRRSDGGPDDPENVIALCPNCHRRVHDGRDGGMFNQQLIEKAERRNEAFIE